MTGEHSLLMKIQPKTVKKIIAYPAVAALTAVCCSCSDEGRMPTPPPTQPEKQDAPKRLPQATSGIVAPVGPPGAPPQPYSGLMAPDVISPQPKAQDADEK